MCCGRLSMRRVVSWRDRTRQHAVCTRRDARIRDRETSFASQSRHATMRRSPNERFEYTTRYAAPAPPPYSSRTGTRAGCPRCTPDLRSGPRRPLHSSSPPARCDSNPATRCSGPHRKAPRPLQRFMTTGAITSRRRHRNSHWRAMQQLTRLAIVPHNRDDGIRAYEQGTLRRTITPHTAHIKKPARIARVHVSHYDRQTTQAITASSASSVSQSDSRRSCSFRFSPSPPRSTTMKSLTSPSAISG